MYKKVINNICKSNLLKFDLAEAQIDFTCYALNDS